MKVLQEAFHLNVDGGECFCVYRFPGNDAVAATILHLPAFGDEMNKARALTARAARAFAARGCGVLQIDLIGCGDSSGDHGDASLARWSENTVRAVEWLRLRAPAAAVSWLWSLRSGALLIPPLLKYTAHDSPLLLWQPVLSGTQQLNHLLRQKLAGTLIDSGSERGGSKALRERLRAGETLAAGGYAISPQLAEDLELATFELPHDFRGRVAWFEVSASTPPALMPAARAKVDGLRCAGIKISAQALEGPGFWQSVEIEQCDALVNASVSALTAGELSVVSRDTVII